MWAAGCLLSALLVGNALAQTPTTRQIGSGRWEVVAHIDPDGERLTNPQLILGVGDTVVVFDYGDFTLRALDRGGRQLWVAGRRGGGPGEFGNPTTLAYGPEGLIWVNDPANGRISRFSRAGRFVDQVTVTEQLTAVLPLARRQFVALGNFENDAFVQFYDSSGRVLRRVALPDSLRGAPLINREAFLAGSDRGASISLRYSDLAYILDLRSLALRQFRGPEHVTFARPVTTSSTIDGKRYRISRANPRAPKASLTLVTGQGRTLQVLFGGSTADSGRVIDEYERASGRYLGSRVLPARVVALTDLKGDVAGIVPDPVPSIYVWRWIPTRSGSAQ